MRPSFRPPNRGMKLDWMLVSRSRPTLADEPTDTTNYCANDHPSSSLAHPPEEVCRREWEWEWGWKYDPADKYQTTTGRFRSDETATVMALGGESVGGASVSQKSWVAEDFITADCKSNDEIMLMSYLRKNALFPRCCNSNPSKVRFSIEKKRVRDDV